MPLPISFFVEAALRSYSADTAHPHTAHFAFDDGEAHTAAARDPPNFETAPGVGSSAARRPSTGGDSVAVTDAARGPAVGRSTGDASGSTAPPSPATSALLPERQASRRAGAAERVHWADSVIEEAAGASQPDEAGASVAAGPFPPPSADALFEPPPGYEVVGEDTFLDDLLDAFLSSIAVDGQHELEVGGGSSPSAAAPARAHLD